MKQWSFTGGQGRCSFPGSELGVGLSGRGLGWAHLWKGAWLPPSRDFWSQNSSSSVASYPSGCGSKKCKRIRNPATAVHFSHCPSETAFQTQSEPYSQELCGESCFLLPTFPDEEWDFLSLYSLLGLSPQPGAIQSS